MKILSLTALALVIPGLSWAHGGHAEVPATAHDVLHLGTFVVLGLGAAGLLAFFRRAVMDRST